MTRSHGSDDAATLVVVEVVMENKKTEAELEAEARALSKEDLVRRLFETTSTTGALADLTRYRALSDEQLFNGLLDHDPSEHGSCKAVLVERKEAAGIDDIHWFMTRHLQLELEALKRREEDLLIEAERAWYACARKGKAND